MTVCLCAHTLRLAPHPRNVKCSNARPPLPPLRLKFIPTVAHEVRYNRSQPEWVSVPATHQRANKLFRPHYFALNEEDMDKETHR